MREIIIADNQGITAFGIQSLIQSDKKKKYVGEAGTKKELLVLLAQYPFALVVLDYTLFDFQSVDDLLIVRQKFENTHWILFSDELSDELLRRLIFTNPSFSVVMKNCEMDEINAALFFASKGERFICNRVSNQLLSVNSISPGKPMFQLTQTEKEILKEIALGRTTKEIATDRNLSYHTIITHRKNIFRKIEVNNVYEATKYAIRAGIIDVADYYI